MMASPDRTAKIHDFEHKGTPSAPKVLKVGNARGIESMFRNSYRAQLDMIALAAMKANIMISLNGFLVFVLLLSATYMLTTEHLLLIPFSLFLLTCTTTLFFAVLSARPDISKELNTLDDFRSDKADLLVFNQFSTLSGEDYGNAMQEMMQDNKRIYDSMISHIYSLGCIADRKFLRLYFSYSAFIVGMLISVISLLLVIAYGTFTAL